MGPFNNCHIKHDEKTAEADNKQLVSPSDSIPIPNRSKWTRYGCIDTASPFLPRFQKRRLGAGHRGAGLAVWVAAPLRPRMTAPRQAPPLPQTLTESTHKSNTHTHQHVHSNAKFYTVKRPHTYRNTYIYINTHTHKHMQICRHTNTYVARLGDCVNRLSCF